MLWAVHVFGDASLGLAHCEKLCSLKYLSSVVYTYISKSNAELLFQIPVRGQQSYAPFEITVSWHVQMLVQFSSVLYLDMGLCCRKECFKLSLCLSIFQAYSAQYQKAAFCAGFLFFWKVTFCCGQEQSWVQVSPDIYDIWHLPYSMVKFHVEYCYLFLFRRREVWQPKLYCQN